MRIGAHQSISGGLEKAVERAVADGCESVQVFTRNQSQWAVKPLAPEAVGRFRHAVERWGVPRARLLAHDSYLINVCAADRDLRRRSLDALVVELERCAALGIGALVMHPGAHLGRGETRALKQVARALTRALSRTEGHPDAAVLLIENTAGQGTTLGHRFEHLRDLLADVEPKARLGICFDTQHAFAAGYDMSTPDGHAATLDELDRVVGLRHVRAFHLNDSKKPLGARVDRHERIGRGHLGAGCFRRLLDDPRFAETPGVLELAPPYPPQLAHLRRLADGTATPKRRPARRRLG